MTFRDLKLLRERIGDDLRDAMSSATPSRKKIRTLTTLRVRLDGVIDSVVEQADPDLAENYALFRKLYREQVIEQVEQGAAFKVRARDGRGLYRTPDEQVAAAFFRPGNRAVLSLYRHGERETWVLTAFGRKGMAGPDEPVGG